MTDDRATAPAPPPAVVERFGGSGPVVVLDGGTGPPAHRCGPVVIKAAGDEHEAEYAADAMETSEVDPARARPSRPVRNVDGAWIDEGWTTWTFVHGDNPVGPQPWSAALDAADALHEGLRAAPPSPMLAARTHRWAVAERVAFDEEPIEVHPALAPLLDRLRRHVRPTTGAAQLVHTDLCGNLLFHPDQPPAIIDFSPGWRPPEFAKAIYVVDAFGWHHGDDALVEAVRADPTTLAQLPRAAVFRVVAYHGRVIDLGLDIISDLPAYEALIDRVLSLVASLA